MIKNPFKPKKGIINLNTTDWLYLLGGSSAYVVLTVWTITKFSIWFDEAFGVYLIKYNFIDIGRYTATDVHPPMYYWILKVWASIFGTSELALRSMSVFFGVVAIFLGYLLINRLFNKKAARLGLLFMVISPMLIRYGQEARMYTLVASIALAATYVLTFAMQSKKKLPWVLYGVLVGLGMWTHYFSAIIWISHWLWRADVVRHTTKNLRDFNKAFFSKEWILAHIVAVGLFLPWVPFFIMQFTIVQGIGFWVPPVNPGTPISFLTNVLYYQDIDMTTGWLAVGFITIVAIMAWLGAKVYQKLNGSERESYRLVMSIGLLPVIVLFVLSLPPLRPVFIDRYLITSVIGIALFIGVTIILSARLLTPDMRRVLILFIVVMMGYGIYSVYTLGNYNKNTHDTNNTRGFISQIQQQAAKGEPIIVSYPGYTYEASYYETPANPIYFIEPGDYVYGSLDMLKYGDAHKIKDIGAFTRHNRTLWYAEVTDDAETKAPYSNWVKIKGFTIKDPVSGELQYKATEYRINN